MKAIQPAQRLENVSEYYFSKKLKEVADLNAAGKNIISLGIGSPDLPPSTATIETLTLDASRPDAHGYCTNGIPGLYNGFADWYKRWFDVELDPKTEILPLIGSKEGIMHISMAFLNPGNGVLVPNPGYPTYTSVSNLVQASIVTYDLDAANGWHPDFEALEKMDLSNVKLMWVNYPNMPTGGRATKSLFEKLVAFGKKHQIVICNDNPYSFILSTDYLSILSVPGAKDICIELNSMSKSHNMPGWRIGMLATNKTFKEWILKVKSNVDSGQFRPMLKAAAMALKAGPEWYAGMNEVYARRRVIAEAILETLGCTWDPNQSGMFLWGRIPDKYADAGQVADMVLYKANVFITPGFIFGSNGNRYIRLSLCCTEQNLSEALQRIKTTI
ncbi:MAG TPA: aminotransferase class I/II-fold pyridoxal phosphate-dependent enzyme [Bacteroidales bacterium]|nr:aminotransferase class I/II-fold pyridoxal phosphate-dependent enzyme [Bacteroidales bacterium]